MSTQAELWKVPEADRPPEQFWTDFSKLVNASFNYEDSEDDSKHDHYWKTLIKWCNVLMDRYNNHIVNMIVMGYLDGQSGRATGRRKDETGKDQRI